MIRHPGFDSFRTQPMHERAIKNNQTLIRTTVSLQHGKNIYLPIQKFTPAPRQNESFPGRQLHLIHHQGPG